MGARLKQRPWILLSLAIVCATLGGVASAQTYGDAMREAEALLPNAGDEREQDTFAFEACETAIESREAPAARIWCAIASRRAVSHIDRRGRPGPGPELDTVRRALWLSAVDGLWLQNNPWWGSPRSETIYIGEGPRGSAYTVIAVMNRREPTLPEFRFEQLARIVGVERERRESVASLRVRTIDQILSKMPTEGRERATSLWALVAASMTIDIVSRDDDRATRAAQAREVNARLRGLAESAETYEGEDGMLAPALYLVEGWSSFLADEHEAAERLLGRGTELCVTRLWRDAAMCQMLEHSYARSIAAVRAHNAEAESEEDAPDEVVPEQ